MKRALTTILLLTLVAPALAGQREEHVPVALREFEKLIPGKPADMIYWAGIDRAATLSADTAFAKLVQGDDMAKLLASLGEPHRTLLGQLAKTEPALADLLMTAWTHPSCLAIVDYGGNPLDPADRAGLIGSTRALLLIQAPHGKNNRDAFTVAALRLLAGLRDDPKPQRHEGAAPPTSTVNLAIEVGSKGNTFIIAIGKGLLDRATSGRDSLADDADYLAVRRRLCTSEPILFSYSSSARRQDSLLKTEKTFPGFKPYHRATLAKDAGFAIMPAGDGFRTHSVVRPAKKAFAPPELDVAITRHLPDDALFGCADSLDPKLLWSTFVALMTHNRDGKVDPTMQKNFEKLQTMIGLDIENDAIGSLGKRIFFYVPADWQAYGPAAAVVGGIELADARAAQAALDKVADFFEKETARRHAGKNPLQAHQHRGTTCYVLSDTWHERETVSVAIVGNMLVVSNASKAVYKHIDRLASKEPGLSTLLALKNQPAGTGAGKPVALARMQTAAAFEHLFALLRNVLPGMRDMPQAPAFDKHLQPTVGITWVQDGNLVGETQGGLPVGGLRASLSAEAAFVPGMLIPILARSRRRADITTSMSRLRQIGLASLMYADAHDERLPRSLAQLVPLFKGKRLDVLRSPLEREVVELDLKTLDKQSSYILNPQFLGAKIEDLLFPSQQVLAIEKPSNFRQGEGILVLFLDGHVEQIDDAKELKRLLEPFGLDKEKPKDNKQKDKP